ncbi:MAG: alpha/beta hydrolase [Ectothiorhodospiraceae bacterium]|jgi:non-heme chloroperoxidase
MFTQWGLPWAIDAETQPELEVLRATPMGKGFDTPVVFVHGAFVAAWCWDVHFLGHFADRGFSCLAPSVRGHGASAGREALQHATLEDYVTDLEHVVRDLDRPPVLVGHSMGGMIVQKYLERNSAAAGVLMASVPPSGLMQSSLRLMLGDPMLFTQLTVMQGLGPRSMDLELARRAVFSDHVPDEELVTYARRMQPESQRAIWDMTAGSLPRPWRVETVPMLVVGAEDDALFTAGEIRSTARSYGADLYMEPGMAHAMMLEPGWHNVAEHIVGWLLDHGIR